MTTLLILLLAGQWAPARPATLPANRAPIAVAPAAPAMTPPRTATAPPISFAQRQQAIVENESALQRARAARARATDPVEAAALDRGIADVQTVSTGLRSGAEMSMLDLQSLVQRRSTLLTEATNVMAGLSQSQGTITNNIGR